MTETFDAEAAWANLLAAEAEPPTHEFRYYRPLVNAIQAFKTDAQATNRVYTGIDQFDLEMRGASAGQLLVVQGHSHSGKTLVATHILRHNRDKRIALFIPDEDAPLILAKLTAVQTGVDAKTLEERVARDDIEAIELLRKVATEDFPTLAVFDEPQDAHTMQRGFDECTLAWGEPPELVVFDFLDQLQVGDSIMPKFDYVKAFGKHNKVPFLLLHQTSRAGGADGRKMTITSGSYGGESHATYMIGVRRKKYALLAELTDLTEKAERNPTEAVTQRLEQVQHDLKIHEFTLTLNLVKNKRVGGSLVDDIDFELQMGTGQLTPLGSGDLPLQYRQTLPRTSRYTVPSALQYTLEEPF